MRGSVEHCFSLGHSSRQVTAAVVLEGTRALRSLCTEQRVLCTERAFDPWRFKLMMVDQTVVPSKSGSFCVFALLVLVSQEKKGGPGFHQGHQQLFKGWLN